jgi:D-3-phosphoglycerate dehydrogenase
MGVELQGKTLSIVGCGRIGQVVAEGAKAIGMKVLGYDPVMTGDGFKEVGLTQATLDQIWEKSDFITFHTPLTPDTKDMLNDVTIAKCKKGVRVINCARGGIINEAALLRGLESGHIAGAGLDVFTSEPPSKDEALTPLLAHPNLICTPHLGASTEEAQLNVAKDIAVQMCDAFDDQQGLTAPDYYFSVVNANYLAASNKPHMPPFVSLAETIGRMQAQIIVGKGSPIKSVVLKTIGARDVNITDKKTRTLLEASMLKGILRHYLSIVGETKPEAKNLIPDLISSPSIAKDVGIESIISGDAPSTNSRSFTNLISVDVELENGTKTNITGAVVGSVPHIVKVDQMEATFKPESNFIVTFRNEDRPGAILEVLNVLSREKVNVGSMSLARSADGTLAQSFVFLDNDITDNGLQMLQSNPTLHNVSRIYLG